MGLSRSERVVLCLLAVAILVGRVVRDRLDRTDDLVVVADSVADGIEASDSSRSSRSRVVSDGWREPETLGSAASESERGTRGGERQDPPGKFDSSATGGADEARNAEPLDLNAATEADLVTLPGIGPAKARAIVEWRTAHGPFERAENLLDVPGIGPKTAAQIGSRVTVKAAKSVQGGSR